MVKSYNEIHWALQRDRGPASEQVCDCGAQAKDWAYQHNGEPEVYDVLSGRPYSEDYDCYKPMCRSCHFTLDATDLQRELGRMVGKSNAVRAQHDEEFSARVSRDRAKAARQANKIQRKCNDCPLVLHPAAMGAHLKGSGHTGYTTLGES